VSESYNIPINCAESKLTDRGSRFLGFASPAVDEITALNILQERNRKYHNATHHCWALRVGDPNQPLERFSDNGEPHFTAGKPIMEQIKKLDLVGVIVIVSRWFGGTKLGRGGLIRAYGGCASEALSEIKIKVQIPKSKFIVECAYDMIGIIEHTVEACQGSVDSGEYSEIVKLMVTVPSEYFDILARRLIEAGNGRITIHL
jgi:uncharacterized YigZ family protein